ncbi:MAG: hypothetical protein OH316_01325 [Candidatus Parvarchaeota archaeon]|nr:hypothetical protein [Candidatus Parvarchaeota archaeon]
MHANKGASGGAVVAIVFILIIIVAFLYFGGYLHIPTTTTTTKTTSAVTAYTFSSTITPSPSLNPGQSGQVIVTYGNPFDEPIATNVSFSVNQPAFLSESPSYQAFSMPATMSSPASITFNVVCSSTISSTVSSTSVLTVESTGVSQVVNTSIVVYPYTTPSSLIPSTVYSSPAGFLSVSASPMVVQTNDLSASTQTANTSMDIIITPTVYSGNVYTQLLPSGANGEISSITVTIDNSSGAIAHAFLYYAGVAYLPVVSGNLLKITIPNVQLSLVSSGLPLTISAFNSVKAPSQNLVGISIDYNYLYSLPGPVITCNS